MKSFFTPEFFINNRRRLRQLVISDTPIVVTANGLLQRGADSTYPFAQDANFWYLTGVDEPNVVLVIDTNDEYMIIPALSDYQRAFDGSKPNTELVKRSGIATILTAETGWERLNARLASAAQVATPSAPPQFIDVYGMYTNPARTQLVQRLTNDRSLDVLDVSQQLMKLRVIKQAPELAAMQQAIDITIAAINDTFADTKIYQHEYQIEAELSRGFRARGASGHAFDPIVAGGKRACTLHNIANNARLNTDELIIVDVGAEVEHYAADITRTFSLNKPLARQQEVYAAVLDVQQYAMDLLKPGVVLKEYEQQVEAYMGIQLQTLGLITTLDHESIRKYYPHSTSHFVGLNVHDTGDGREPLQANMVITVEPGIYISEEGIGVRIEDDVIITNSGLNVLSKALTKELC